MQDILKNTPKEKQQIKAWAYAIGITILVSSFMFLNAGDQDVSPELVKSIDPIILLIGNAVGSIFIFFGISFVLIKFVWKLDLSFFFREINLTEVGLTFAILFLSMISLSIVGEWNMNIDYPDGNFENWAKASEETLKVLTEYITNFQSTSHFIVGFITIAIIPAIIEELLFRGVLQNLFNYATKNPHIAIWISAIIFGTIHMQFYGVFPRILLGALFGYLYFWSGNLLIPMLAHFLNNGIGVTIYYLYQKGAMGITPEQLDSAAPLPFVIGSALILSFLLFYFHNFQAKENG